MALGGISIDFFDRIFCIFHGWPGSAVLEGPVIFQACLWENKLLEQRGKKFLTAD